MATAPRPAPAPAKAPRVQEQKQGQKRPLQPKEGTSAGVAKIFKVGDVVQYRSTSKGGWIDTIIKAVRLDDNGKVVAYDCSGKQGAAVSKVRAKKAAASTPKTSTQGTPAKAESSAADGAGAPVPKSGGKALSAVKADKAAKAPQRPFKVGERVRYWRKAQRAWLDTRVKAVNVDQKGEILSYDLSGKPRAEPHRIRAAKAKATSQVPAAGMAPGARPAEAESGLVFGNAKRSAGDGEKKAPPAKFKVGQTVMYFSGQVQKYLPTKVIRSVHSRSGKRYYDLSIKKGVLESRIRAAASKDSKKQPVFGAESGSQLSSTQRAALRKQMQQAQLPAEKRRNLQRVPAPPADDAAEVEAENPPGPPTP
eukprot:symbB.v1.2.024941.t1/scaffold2396.1/size80221/7